MTNSRKPYIWSVEMSKVAWSENFKTTLKWETYIISWKWSEKITLTMNCISSVINWFPWSQIYIVMFSTRSTHEHSWNRLHIIMERRICTNRRSAYKKWFCINAPIPSTSLSLSPYTFSRSFPLHNNNILCHSNNSNYRRKRDLEQLMSEKCVQKFLYSRSQSRNIREIR